MTLLKKRRFLLLIPVAAAVTVAVLKLTDPFSQKVQPRIGPIVEAVYGIGTVTSRHTFTLKIGVTDTLGRLFVQEGDRVKKGAALVAFSDGRTSRAPFDGIVTSLPYKEGETVFPQLPVLVLTDMKNPYVVLTLEQSAAVRVRVGQEALLSFENLRSQRLNGKVTSLYPKEGQFYVNIEVPSIPPELLVGMTGDVAVQVASREKVLQVPLSTVDKGKVTVIRNGVAKSVPVKLGAADGLWGEVAEGDIKLDDKLVSPKGK